MKTIATFVDESHPFVACSLCGTTNEDGFLTVRHDQIAELKLGWNLQELIILNQSVFAQPLEL